MPTPPGATQFRSTSRTCCEAHRLPTPISRLETPVSRSRPPAQLPVVPAESAELACSCFEDILEANLEVVKASLLSAHRRDYSARDACKATESAQAPVTGAHLPESAGDCSELLRQQSQLQEQLSLTLELVKTASDDIQELRSALPQIVQGCHDKLIRTMSAMPVECRQTQNDTPEEGMKFRTSEVSVEVEYPPPPPYCDSTDKAKQQRSHTGWLSITTNELSETGKSWKLLVLDIVPAFAIMANALVIGLSSDVYQDSLVWECFEIFFTMFFACELSMNLRMRGCRAYFVGEAFHWNWFDVLCLLTAAVDLGITYVCRLALGREGADLGGLMVVKMLRLARLMRLVRLLRFPIFAELKMIVHGVFCGMRVLVWAILLLTFVVFVLGIVFRQLVGDKEPEFSTVPSSMFSLFRCFTDGCDAYNGTPLTERLRKNYGAFFTIAYSLMYLFVTFGIFNLIMAVFIDNVSSQQHLRKLREIGENSVRTREFVSDALETLYNPKSMHMDSNKLKSFVRDNFPSFSMKRRSSLEPKAKINRQQFNKWLKKQETLKMLEDIEVETATKHELFDVLDINMDGYLSKHEVVDGLMRLRGVVTKTDIVAIRMKVQHMTRAIDYLSETVIRHGERLSMA